MNFFNLRAKKFYFLKYKKKFFWENMWNIFRIDFLNFFRSLESSLLKFFSLGARKFHFSKYKSFIFLKKYNFCRADFFFIFRAYAEKWPRQPYILLLTSLQVVKRYFWGLRNIEKQLSCCMVLQICSKMHAFTARTLDSANDTV